MVKTSNTARGESRLTEKALADTKLKLAALLLDHQQLAVCVLPITSSNPCFCCSCCIKDGRLYSINWSRCGWNCQYFQSPRGAKVHARLGIFTW